MNVPGNYQFAAFVLSILLVFGALAHAAEKSEQERIRLGGYRQLFVDDHLIAELDGVQRVIGQVHKHPANPVVSAEYPSEGNLVYLYGSVVHDREKNIFKMGPDPKTRHPASTQKQRVFAVIRRSAWT